MKNIFKVFIGILFVTLTLLIFSLNQSNTHAQLNNFTNFNTDPNYNLSDGKIFDQVLHIVLRDYVDTSRIVPYKMLLSSLEYLQLKIPEVMVSVNEQTKNSNIAVTVNKNRKEIQVDRNLTPWHFSRVMKDLFGFFEDNLAHQDDIKLRDIEYISINGMLHTLDPHSQLMTPDDFEDMRVGTQGQFGGLGIIITVQNEAPCNGKLTIMEVIPNSPAEKIGLKSFDQILAIENQPTDCMTLEEAVDRMRGEVGTTVNILVSRREWREPHNISIIRELIHVDSVESKILEGNIGYVKIDSFQENTYSDLVAHLSNLDSSQLNGLVLDLRGNPGGLLEIAAQVADLFISAGTIVVTAGNNPDENDIRNATFQGTEPNYPLIVLIDQGSASASEIVAGALQNHNRAIVMGEPSFGKGSVQFVFTFSDGSALKLTVAQYLTSGTVSLQTIGVIPDIALQPIRVERNFIDLEPDIPLLRESDLESHLSYLNTYLRPVSQTTYNLPIWVPDANNYRNSCPYQRRCNDKPGEELKEKMVEIARTILVSTKNNNNSTKFRNDFLNNADAVIKQIDTEQNNIVGEKLKKSGIIWQDGQDKNEASFDVSIEHEDFIPGKQAYITLKVKNKGPGTVYKLRAISDSDNYVFKGIEFVFGEIGPGETKSWTSKVCIPDSSIVRNDPVVFEFKELNKRIPTKVEDRFEISSKNMPEFFANYRWEDVTYGNGDGLIESGEKIKLYLSLKNIGKGVSNKTIVYFHNLSIDGVKLAPCRFFLNKLMPQKSVEVSNTFEINQPLKNQKITFEIVAYDDSSAKIITQKINLPVAPSNPILKKESNSISLLDNISVFQSPDSNSTKLGTLQKGGTISSDALINSGNSQFLRVVFAKKLYGWIEKNNVNVTSGAKNIKNAFKFISSQDNRPPVINIQNQPDLIVKTDHIDISGEITGEEELLDFYVFVDEKKEVYQSNNNKVKNLPFNIQLNLHGGMNKVVIIARSISKLVSKNVFYIRRDNTDGSAIISPKLRWDLIDSLP